MWTFCHCQSTHLEWILERCRMKGADSHNSHNSVNFHAPNTHPPTFQALQKFDYVCCSICDVFHCVMCSHGFWPSNVPFFIPSKPPFQEHLKVTLVSFPDTLTVWVREEQAGWKSKTVAVYPRLMGFNWKSRNAFDQNAGLLKKERYDIIGKSAWCEVK